MAKKSEVNQNKNIIYALFIVAVVFVLFWALKMGKKAVKELDSTDLNAIDKELNGLDSDTSSF